MPCGLSPSAIQEAKQRLMPLITEVKYSLFTKRMEKANQEIYYKFKVRQAQRIIELAHEIFYDNMVVAFSGGKDSLVVLHLTLKKFPQVPVLFNNTTVEFPETVMYVKKLQKEWGFTLYITQQKKPFLKAVEERGWASHENRWCCKPYKDQPAFNFLKENEIDAEITGTTRTESIYRRSLTPFRIPKRKPSILRINPIYDWNQWEVWRYIKENQLPYNPLYDKGYRRIGCWCCPLNGPSHYKRLRKTHSTLFNFLRKFRPPHPVLSKL